MLNIEQVEALREEIFADGVVTKEEFLKVHEAKTEITISTFDELYAEAGMAFLLADGEIDEEEAQFIIDIIGEDGRVDDAEEELLSAIGEHYNEGNEVPKVLIDTFPNFFVEEEDEEEDEDEDEE